MRVDERLLTERLARINDNLARKIASRNEYDKTIQETEAAYAKASPCMTTNQRGAWARLSIRRLGLLDGFVVLVARGNLASKIVIDAGQPFRQDAQIILNLGCKAQTRDTAHGSPT